MGVKKAVAATFIIILLLIAAYYTGWLDILLEVFTGMNLRELLGERLEEFSVLSVKLVKVRDSSRSYACSMKIIEYEGWDVKEQKYIRTRRPYFENWSFSVFQFIEGSWHHCEKYEELNWTVAEIDGKEMLVITLPANHSLEFYRKIFAKNLTVLSDVWFRADIRFLSGPASLMYVEPPEIRSPKGIPEKYLFYIVAHNQSVLQGDFYFRSPLRLRVLAPISLWEHRRCTVTATIEDFVSPDEFAECIGWRVKDTMRIRILPEPNITSYTVALSADFFEPDFILEVEVRNGRNNRIISFSVEVGSDVIDVKPRDFIKKGESYVFRVAPRGNFRVGETYNVTVTALFEDYKTLSVTRQATCESS